jgi:hypothetical protein
MNAHAFPIIKDARIKKELQLAGLRFAIARAVHFIDQAKELGIALKDGTITPDEADIKLKEMDALGVVYGDGI